MKCLLCNKIIKNPNKNQKLHSYCRVKYKNNYSKNLMRKRIASNRDAWNLYYRKKYQENKDQRIEYYKNYRERNREKLREYNRNYSKKRNKILLGQKNSKVKKVKKKK